MSGIGRLQGQKNRLNSGVFHTRREKIAFLLVFCRDCPCVLV